MDITIYKNTNFGNNDMVYNIPSADYNFNLHEKTSFLNVKIRFPLLTNTIILKGDYELDTVYYDYMYINDNGQDIYYFIDGISAIKGSIVFSVSIDIITTYKITEEPISGVLLRKHDINLDEDKFDYPTALNWEGAYTNNIYDIIKYDDANSRFIESAINLSTMPSAETIVSGIGGDNVTVPALSLPNHSTLYKITTWASGEVTDNSKALTLYNQQNVSKDVLNVVRGLSGDGAISDAYMIPTEAITTEEVGSEVHSITGNFVTKVSELKNEINFEINGIEEAYTPKNKAIEGNFRVSIMSQSEKTKISFPGWDVRNSVDENDFLTFNLWCDAKPSGSPFCCPTQVESVHPLANQTGVWTDALKLASLENKSVRGSQWLRSPLLYTTGEGELFSTIQTQLQREKAAYERDASANSLQIAIRERDINISQQKFNSNVGLLGSGLSAIENITSGNPMGLIGDAMGAGKGLVNQDYLEQMQSLKAYQQNAEGALINRAYGLNLKNLNVQENIRRINPPQLIYEQNESLGNYASYNCFTISIEQPDFESIKAKDLEFTLYGYPVSEVVENYIMDDNLRVNHSVFQIENAVLEIGGAVGNIAREILRNGIRILSNKYSMENLLNNPKVGE